MALPMSGCQERFLKQRLEVGGRRPEVGGLGSAMRFPDLAGVLPLSQPLASDLQPPASSFQPPASGVQRITQLL
jgi:hypothetical protein